MPSHDRCVQLPPFRPTPDADREIQQVVEPPVGFGLPDRVQQVLQLRMKVGHSLAILVSRSLRLLLSSVEKGQRIGPLRFGDERVMAVVGAPCVNLRAVAGFTNGSLRALVAGLLGAPYSAAQMTYDLRRLRLKGPDPAPGTPEPLRRHFGWHHGVSVDGLQQLTQQRG